MSLESAGRWLLKVGDKQAKDRKDLHPEGLATSADVRQNLGLVQPQAHRVS